MFIITEKLANIYMEVAIIYEKNKVLQALRYHFIARPEVKILLILVNVFALVSAVLLGLKLIHPMPFLVSSILWFGLMLSFWFWIPRLVYKRSQTFKEEIVMNLRQADILIETERGNASWEYKRFIYFIESPFFFHLYMSEKSFFLIPKDACIGDSDTVSVRELLIDKIGRKK